jgi:hypothetical protein
MRGFHALQLSTTVRGGAQQEISVTVGIAAHFREIGIGVLHAIPTVTADTTRRGNNDRPFPRFLLRTVSAEYQRPM